MSSISSPKSSGTAALVIYGACPAQNVGGTNTSVNQCTMIGISGTGESLLTTNASIGQIYLSTGGTFVTLAQAPFGRNDLNAVYTASSGSERTTITSFDIPSTDTALTTPLGPDYAEINSALLDLRDLAHAEDWKIDDPVYDASAQVLVVIAEKGIPQPSMFTHGPKSVVFNWTISNVDLYLTVTKSKLSVLASSPNKILHRSDSTQIESFFSALSSAAARPNSDNEETHSPAK